MGSIFDRLTKKEHIQVRDEQGNPLTDNEGNVVLKKNGKIYDPNENNIDKQIIQEVEPSISKEITRNFKQQETLDKLKKKKEQVSQKKQILEDKLAIRKAKSEARRDIWNIRKETVGVITQPLRDVGTGLKNIGERMSNSLDEREGAFSTNNSVIDMNERSSDFFDFGKKNSSGGIFEYGQGKPGSMFDMGLPNKNQYDFSLSSQKSSTKKKTKTKKKKINKKKINKNKKKSTKVKKK